ncbi:hypothetical protein [Bradyrhizobium sp.]|jgi:hypothetical protein|uniref:hypothetical protein n=1 Tax=Bradyrhizobium sp. TaxID=376 RepID=UPI0025C5CD6E|nr:hypothetical protein [Bradyrhizobium sp.]
MDQVSRLKLGSIAFTIFWVGGMLWWSGIYDPAHVVILSICGALAGYFWYRAMLWSFRRMRLLHDG